MRSKWVLTVKTHEAQPSSVDLTLGKVVHHNSQPLGIAWTDTMNNVYIYICMYACIYIYIYIHICRGYMGLLPSQFWIHAFYMASLRYPQVSWMTNLSGLAKIPGSTTQSNSSPTLIHDRNQKSDPQNVLGHDTPLENQTCIPLHPTLGILIALYICVYMYVI